MSKIDNLFVLHGGFTYFFNSNKKLYAAFVDFTYLKVLDYSVRDVIWYKLIEIGVE